MTLWINDKAKNDKTKKIRDFMTKESFGISIMEKKFTWLIKNFTNDFF